jgi:hypothetical protein
MRFCKGMVVRGKKSMLMILCLFMVEACKHNPFGDDVYKGRVVDKISGKGIKGAKVVVAGKPKDSNVVYKTVSSGFSDANGDYLIRYKRCFGYQYCIYAEKERFRSDGLYSDDWGYDKKTDIWLQQVDE